MPHYERIFEDLPKVYRYSRRLGDTMTESGFSAKPVDGEKTKNTAYFRGDAVNTLVDDLAQALRMVRADLETEPGTVDTDTFRRVRGSLHRAEKFRAAMADREEADAA